MEEQIQKKVFVFEIIAFELIEAVTKIIPVISTQCINKRR